jgi:hypothetical protein
MAFPIITADQRLAEKRGIKGCILDTSGMEMASGRLSNEKLLLRRSSKNLVSLVKIVMIIAPLQD